MLAAGPPSALVCYFMSPRAFTTWFAIWGLWNYVPLKREILLYGGRALTTYAAWRSLDETMFPRAQEGESSIASYRMLGAIGVGLMMGVAYRNLIHALDWLVSDMPKRPTSPTRPQGGWVDTSGRPSVRISLRPGGDGNGAHVAPIVSQEAHHEGEERVTDGARVDAAGRLEDA